MVAPEGSADSCERRTSAGGFGKDQGFGVFRREVLEGGEQLVDVHHAPLDRQLAVERAGRPEPDSQSISRRKCL